MVDGISILIVDDHRLFASSLKQLLEHDADDIVVAGMCYNGQEALDYLATTPVDLVLLDVRMPVMDGVRAMREIAGRHPAVKVLMLSTFNEEELVTAALRLGARGYLLKDSSPLELITAIRAMRSATIQISPAVTQKLVSELYQTTSADPGAAQREGKLSKREREVFRLLSRGYDNKEIATRLFLSEHTVRNHVSAIYARLGVKDRFKLIRMNKEVPPEETTGGPSGTP